MSQDDKEKNKYLFKNTAIFAVGNLASKFISFFLVPLYTNCMVASEYGTADLLYTICNFLIPLFTLNITEAVLRFSLDKNADRKKIVHIASKMIVPLVLFGAIVLPILNLFENYGQYALYFYAYLVTTATSQIFLIALKGQEKLKLFSFGNVLHTVLITILNLVFLLGLSMGIAGYFLAYIISNIVVTVFAAINCHAIKSVKESVFDKRLFKDMVKYSAVLIPTTFMWWIMNFLDRVMISGMINVSESGIYAVSYKIPTILSSVSSIFMQAWLFSAIKNNGTEENAKYSNKVFRMLCFILVATSLPLLIFIRQIFGFYVAPEYYVAWEYVPSLMIGHIFLTLSTFISTSYNVGKDSKGFLRSASVGAIVNLILNAILIPLIGAQGAAIATSISYISVFAYRLFDTRKYIRLQFTTRMFASIIAALAVSAVAFLSDYIRWPVAVISTMFFVIINIKEFKTVLESVSGIFNKIFHRKNT